MMGDFFVGSNRSLFSNQHLSTGPINGNQRHPINGNQRRNQRGHPSCYCSANGAIGHRAANGGRPTGRPTRPSILLLRPPCDGCRIDVLVAPLSVFTFLGWRISYGSTKSACYRRSTGPSILLLPTGACQRGRPRPAYGRLMGPSILLLHPPCDGCRIDFLVAPLSVFNIFNWRISYGSTKST